MVDLRSLVSSGPDLQLVYAIGINDRGEIAGNGVPAGKSTAPPFQDTMSHAFVLIPCDENHPNVEGCDYSLVDSAAATEVHPAQTTTPPAAATSPAKLSPAEMMSRFRSMLATRNRRFGTLPPK